MTLIIAHGLPKSGSTFLFQVAKDVAASINGFPYVEAKPIPIIERAFELARSGGFENFTTIRRQLAREGFSAVSSQTTGRTAREGA